MAVIGSSTSTTENFSQTAQAYRNQLDELLAKQDLERVRAGGRPLYDSRYSSGVGLDEYEQLYGRLLGIQDEQTRGRMELANFYRTKEGATAAQRDEQAFRRLSSQLENQRFMQSRGQELTNWQREQDFDRANRAIKQYRGLRTG